MGANGIVTDAMKNVVANAYAGAGLYLTLLRPLTLQSSVAAGAQTCSVDLSVAVGDLIVFDQGLSTQEQATVSAVSGAGPYSVTLGAPVTFQHITSGSNAGMQSHLPLLAATVHEVASITRVAASWSSPSPAGTVSSSAGTINVPAGTTIGSVAVYSASTAGTYYDASAITPQTFTAAGTFRPQWIEVSG